MTDYEASVYLFAARYARTRNTGAALIVVNNIIAAWDEIPHRVLKKIISETRQEAEYCVEDWNLLIDKWDRENG